MKNQRLRIVVKIGSSSITEENGQLSLTKLESYIDQLARLDQEENVQLILVSSGAVALGMAQLGWRRKESPHTQELKFGAPVSGASGLSMTHHLFADRFQIPLGQLAIFKKGRSCA